MQKGFVTIATGDERYYRMARTLLRSYRQTCTNPMRFAIIADRENKYTKEFDNIVILDNPTYSWMDKMRLLDVCPYDENIFIDADCLVYQDINFFWNLFSDADDFSCFGQALPMDSQEGWFTAEAANIYPIQFITHLHGICYFVRPGERITKMGSLCREIISNYNAVQYRGFNEKLADEPVFALAMAILGMKPIDRAPYYYCFVPFATEIDTNYYKKEVTFKNPKDGKVNSCCIVHWGNQNTKKAQYRFDAYAVERFEQGVGSGAICHYLFEKKWLLYIYRIHDKINKIYRRITWLLGRVWSKLTGKG